MIITNDILTFEPSDIAQLSPELQTALDVYSAPHPVEALLSRIVNDALNRARALRVNSQLADLRKALADATPEKRAEAELLIAQTETVLGLDKP